MALSPFARRYDAVLLDLDGCVWVGDEPTPGAVEAVAAVRSAGIALAFVTNDARHAPEDFVRKLWRLGFQASASEIVTVGSALQHHLATSFPEGTTAFVIGAQAIVDHVAFAGLRVLNGTPDATAADVVVVAGHEEFDYAELRTGTQAVLAGAALVGAGRDATFPMPDGPWPASGAVLAAVETATGAVAHTVGKPGAELVHTAIERCSAQRPVLIGDRLDSDLGAALAAGIDGAIVLTGATGALAAAEADPAPVAVGDTLAALLLA